MTPERIASERMTSEAIDIHPCAWQDIAERVAATIRSRGIRIESFWEDHVLEGSHYRFARGGETVGSFIIHGQEALWWFELAPQVAAQGQALFARARQTEKVAGAWALTGDDFFLSHIVDNFARVEKQAYISTYLDVPAPPGAPAVALRRFDAARAEDLAVLARTDDFFEPEELERMRAGAPYQRLDIAEAGGEAVGIGVAERGRVLPEISSIGLCVLAAHRRRGFGAAILRALRDRERAAGLEPRSGCWYYNHASKRAQERAGAYMTSRMLRFFF
jgi:GNAT superfamily N-acetyltransferase